MGKRKKTGGRKSGTLNQNTAEIKSIARQHGIEAIDALVEIMRQTKSDATCLAAIKNIRSCLWQAQQY